MTRGTVKGRDRDISDSFNPDGEEIKEESAKYSQANEEDKDEFESVVNGDILPDDQEEFDYEMAKRDSEIENIQQGRKKSNL